MDIINLCFTNVSFGYNTSHTPVINNLSVTLQKGWTGIIGANGIGKTTFAKLACGLLLPDKGSVLYTGKNTTGIYCEQETNLPPEKAKLFLNDEDNYTGKIRSILNIQNDWLGRWESLSYGERKKFQVAVALWENPDILVLDEPTNHLDKITTERITESLLTYNGTGIIISHNRILLDILCGFCLFMDTENAILRKGNLTEGLAQQEIENKQKERDYINSYENFTKLDKSAKKLKQKLSSKKNSLSKKHLDKNDHDGKSKIDGLRLLGKDAVGVKKLVNLQTRTGKAKEEMEKSYFKKREIEGFTLNGKKSERNFLISLEEKKQFFSNGISIEIPNLTIKPEDKIGIEGDNGTGKSTLIKFLLDSIDLPHEKIIYISQEINPVESENIMREINSLNRNELGMLLTVIYRLGSEPERILNTEKPSPGELRKLTLGLGLLKTPELIIMDEPTNHMDLPSVLCLENALKDFKGALILISHDRLFLDKVTNIRWEITLRNSERNLSIKY